MSLGAMLAGSGGAGVGSGSTGFAAGAGAGTGAMQATEQLLGIANCRQAVGIPSLNAPMYRLHSSSLLILPTVLKPPSGSLKNAVQVLRPASYAKQATFGPLYCCKHSGGGVAGAESETGALQDDEHK